MKNLALLLALLFGLGVVCSSGDTGGSEDNESETSQPTAAEATQPPDEGATASDDAASEEESDAAETASEDAGPTVEPSAEAALASTEYTVQAGDTLGAIAKQHGTTTQALIEANALADPDRLSIGQVLVIPGAEGSAPVAGAGTDTSAEEEAYREFVREASDDYLAAATEISAQFSALSEDASLYLDEAWRIHTAVQLGVMIGVSDLILERTPPERFASFHTDLSAVATDVKEGAILMSQGLDELDADKINAGSLRMIEANEGLNNLPVEEILEP